MSACVGASIELGCRKRKLRYIPQAEILKRNSATLELPLAYGKLVPDGLFGIEYPAGFLFFAVEIDRKTESIERSSPGQSAFGTKLKNYLEAFETRAFKSYWAIPNLMVLTVTTNVAHLANMVAYLQKFADEKQAQRFIFRAKQEFGAKWSVPPVMDDLLSEKWIRAGQPFDLSSAS